MSFLFSGLLQTLAVEFSAGVLVVNFLALTVLFAGCSVWFRWLFPLLKGETGREPLCFRETAKSKLGITPPSSPVLLATFWIAIQLLLALKHQFYPPPTPETLPDINLLVGNVVIQFGIGGFLLLLWEFTSESGKLSTYFRVEDWKLEVKAGAELMLLVMPCTFLLALISVLWKTAEDMHPLLQLLQQEGGIGLMIGIGITAAVIAPLIEELLFRVLLLNGLIDPGRLHRIAAWIIVSVCFSLAHGFADALQLLPLSLSLGWCLLRQQSYLAIIVAHAMFNGFMLLLAMLAML